MRNVFISVIVTAYNRREFLLEALNSVVNQTLSRDKYEIICIKNFKDEKIDDYASKNNILNILTGDLKMGEYFYIGNIGNENAKGNILVFLDDDDVFSREKLERIYNVFLNKEVGFYHNNCLKGSQPILNDLGVKNQSNYKIIKHYYFHRRKIREATFNSSSMAIKKSILDKYKEEFKSIYFVPDVFLGLICLLEKEPIFFDKNKLTFYRIHDKNMSRLASLEQAINAQIHVISVFEKFLLLAQVNKSPAGVRLIKTLLFISYERLNIRKKEKRLKVLKDAIKYFTFTFDPRVFKYFSLIVMYLMGLSFPYKRLTREFTNK